MEILKGELEKVCSFLLVDEREEMQVNILKSRFNHLIAPHCEDVMTMGLDHVWILR